MKKPSYRKLRVGEIIRKGDQWEWTSGNWSPAYSTIGSKVQDGTYRRPITPRPTAKRKGTELNEGEIVKAGDEIKTHDRGWQPVSDWLVGRPLKQARVRRPVNNTSLKDQ